MRRGHIGRRSSRREGPGTGMKILGQEQAGQVPETGRRPVQLEQSDQREMHRR